MTTIQTVIKKAFLVLKKTNEILFTKELRQLLLLLLIVVFGSNVLIQFCSQFLVDPIFSLVRPSFTKDIICVIIAALTLFFFFRKAKDYLPNSKVLFGSIVISLFYFYFRFIDTSIWTFSSFENFAFLKYADLLFVTGTLSLFYVVILMNKHFRKIRGPHSNFFVDEPIKTKRNDILGYHHYAASIANIINTSKFDKAFAIGVTSKWGGGKTSFFYMIEEELDEDLIKIQFNPWRSANPQAIVKDFFQTIEASISKYSSQLSKLLNQYGNQVLELDDNVVTKLGKLIFSFSEKDSLDSLYKQINSSIRLLDKRLVIFIDDVDRLYQAEVFEVIRLIRNTANFQNTCFIVAYDRTYVLHALENMGVHHYETFLEKIFQLEITLPYFNESVLVSQFIKNMKRTFPNRNTNEIENCVLKSDGDRVVFLEWIQTLRDVTRLCNSIMLNIKNVETEVDIVDFIRVEILRFKYPSVYEVLFKKSDNFLELKYSNYRKNEMLSLTTEMGLDDNPTGKTVLEAYLRQNLPQLSIIENDVEKIVQFVEDIFSDNVLISFSNKYVASSHLTITNIDRFHLYFSYGLIPGILPEQEFLTAIKYKLPELFKEVDLWVSELKEEKVKSRLTDLTIEHLSERQSFENIVKAIFYLANLESKISLSGMKIKYDLADLFNKINFSSKFVKHFYKDQGEYKLFINELFENENSNYYFEAEFIVYISPFANTDHSLPIEPILTATQIEYFLIKYLKYYCIQEQELVTSIWQFWRYCKIPTLVRQLHPEEEIHIDACFPEARSVFVDFISTKDLNTFLLYNIHINFPDGGNLFQIGTLGNEVLGSLVKFEAFLIAQDEVQWSYLEEYKRFHFEAKKSGSKLIPFEFKVIDVQRRIDIFNKQNNIN